MNYQRAKNKARKLRDKAKRYLVTDLRCKHFKAYDNYWLAWADYIRLIADGRIAHIYKVENGNIYNSLITSKFVRLK